MCGPGAVRGLDGCPGPHHPRGLRQLLARSAPVVRAAVVLMGWPSDSHILSGAIMTRCSALDQ
eukprot:15268360-Alexandrium_andersonii.AAC.1